MVDHGEQSNVWRKQNIPDQYKHILLTFKNIHEGYMWTCFVDIGPG